MFFDEVPWCFEEVPEVEGVSERLRREGGCRAQRGGPICQLVVTRAQ